MLASALVAGVVLCGCSQGDAESAGSERHASAGSGVVVGTVRSARTGRALRWAAVVPESLDRPPQPTPLTAAVTDARGRYRWELPAGRWAIAVSAPSYRTASKAVRLRSGQRAVRDFSLR
jgi:hypothetical protein